MPLDISVFRNAVQGQDNGFIQLDAAQQSISTYATNGLVRGLRLYTAPTDQQNLQIRQQFYNALTANREYTTDALNEIRHALGISETGQAQVGEKLDIQTAKQLLRLADDANANKIAREQMITDLFPEDEDPWDVREKCRIFVGLGDSEMATRGLPNNLRQQVTAFKNAMISQKRTMMLQKCNVPSENQLREAFGNDRKVLDKYTRIMGAGPATPRDVMTLCAAINGAWIRKVTNSIGLEDMLQVRLDELSLQTGMNCAPLRKKFASYVLDRLAARFTSVEEELVAHADDTTIRQALNELVEGVLQSKATMFAQVDQALQEGRISAAAAECAKTEIATNMEFRKPGILSAVLPFLGKVKDFMTTALKQGKDLGALLKAVDDYHAQVSVPFVRALKDANIRLDPDSSSQISHLIFRMAKVEIAASSGEFSNEEIENLAASMGVLESEQLLLDDILSKVAVTDGFKVTVPKDPRTLKRVGWDRYNAMMLLGNVMLAVKPSFNPGNVPTATNFTQATRNRLIDQGFIFTNDTPFTPVNQHLSPKFQEALLADLGRSVGRHGNESADAITAWAMGDFTRLGTSLTLDGEPFSYAVNGHPKQPEKLLEFFKADEAHGDAAAKYILSFMGQGLSIAGRNCMDQNGELSKFFATSMFGGIQKYDLRRTEDGKYELDAEISYSVREMSDSEGNTVGVNPAHSTVHQNIKLELSFDEQNTPTLKFRETPTVRCDLQPAGYNDADKDAFDAHPQMLEGREYLSTSHYAYQGGFSDPQVWEKVRSGDLEGAFLRLIDLTYSASDALLLRRCGLDDVQQHFLCSDLLGTGQVLTDSLVQKLLSGNADTRDEGLEEFQQLCQPWIEAGLLDPNFHLNLGLLRIRDLPEVISNQANKKNCDDFSILCGYVNRHADDEACQALLEKLSSPWSLNPMELKELLAPVLTAARREANLLDLLQGQLNLKLETAQLVVSVYKARVDGDLIGLVENFLAHELTDAEVLMRIRMMEPNLVLNKQYGDFKATLDQAVTGLKLTGEAAERFRSMAGKLYFQSRNQADFDFAKFCADLKSPASHVFRALRYPEISQYSRSFDRLLDIFSVIDEVFATKTNADWNGLVTVLDTPAKKAGCILAYEKIVLQDLMFKNGGRLPTEGQVRDAIAAPDNWYDALMYTSYGSCGPKIIPMVSAMPLEKREAFVRAAKPFGEGLNEIAAHLDEIVAAFEAGTLTPEKTWEICWGEPLPEKYGQHLHSAFTDKVMDTQTSQFAPQNFPAVVAMLASGIPFDNVVRMFAGENVPFQFSSPYASGNFATYDTFKMLDPEQYLCSDILRMNDGYSIPVPGQPGVLQQVQNIRQGSVFTFHTEGQGKIVFDTSKARTELQGEDLQNFLSMKSSSISRGMLEQITQMCGAEHCEQIINTCLCLSQCGMDTMFPRAMVYGVKASEHTQAVFDIRKEGENVIVRVSNPENCPLKFSWDIVLGPKGEQTFVMGEFGRQILPETQAMFQEFGIPKTADLDATKYPASLLRTLEALEASFYPTREEVAAVALEVNQTRVEMFQGELVQHVVAKVEESFVGINVPDKDLLIGNVLRLANERMEQILTKDTVGVKSSEALLELAKGIVETIAREKSEAIVLVTQHAPAIPVVAANAMQTEILTSSTLNSSAQVNAILNSFQLMEPLMAMLASDQPVDKQGFLNAFHGVQANLLKARRQLQEENPAISQGAVDAFLRQVMEYSLKAGLDDHDFGNPQALQAAKLAEATLLAFKEVLDSDGALSDGGKLLLDEEGKAMFQQELVDLRQCIQLLGGILNVPEEDVDVANVRESLVDSKAMLSTVGIGVREPFVYGQVIDKQMSASYQRHMLAMFTRNANDALKRPLKEKETHPFSQVLGDLLRTGFGWSLDGELLVSEEFSVRDSKNAPERATIEARILDFFAKDKVHGEEAAKIIGEFAHQGLGADLTIGLGETREVIDGKVMVSGGRFLFDVRRNDDGSYSLQCDCMQMLVGADTGDGEGIVEVSRDKSRLMHSFTLRLAFSPDGTYQLTYEVPPTVKMTVGKIQGMGFDEIISIGLSKAGTEEEKRTLESELSWMESDGLALCNDPQFAVILRTAGGIAPVLDYLQQHYITKADCMRLMERGLSGEAVTVLMNDFLSTGNRLTKAQVTQLLDGTREEQQAVKAEIEELLTPYVEKKWFGAMPNITVNIQNANN